MKKIANFLKTDEREYLKTIHRKESERRTADRIKAVLLADGGWSYKQIAKALLLDDDTVSQHVNEYMENKKLRIQTGGSEVSFQMNKLKS
jgi:DNA-binding NarL/FixJ family response regulator